MKTTMPAMLQASWHQLQSSLQAPPAHALTRAGNDGEAIRLWLAEYRNPHTHDALRKEAERFVLWAAWRGQQLADIRREDIHAYQQFLPDPQPAEIWCGQRVARQLPDGSLNPAWRPFLRGLSARSQQLALTRLGNLYSYLVETGYLAHNPFKLRRGRQMTALQRDIAPERLLDEAMWQALQSAIATLPADDERARGEQCRLDWLCHLLYYTGARRSEIITARMGDLVNRGGHWWWRILGKGNVRADIPLPARVLPKLVAYRHSLGLPALPLHDEDTPLLCALHPGRQQQPLTPRHLHDLLRQLLNQAASLPALAGDEHLATRDALQRASAHWFRHSYATRLLQSGARLDETRRLLRHASIQTTQLYLHQADSSLVEAVSRL